MPVPEEDLRTRILAASISGATSSSVFTGPVLPPVEGGVPSKAVFVHQAPGFKPIDFHETGSERRAVVGVRVRGDAEAREDGRAFAEAVWNAVHRCTIAGYVAVECMQDRAEWIGQDEGKRHEWVFNVLMVYEA